MGENSAHRRIDLFQSLERFREQGFPHDLPARLEADLNLDPQLCELRENLHKLKLWKGSATTLPEAERHTASYYKKLYRVRLREYQKKWVQDRRDWKILSRGKEVSSDTSKTDLVKSIFLLIPERARLAQKMAPEESLTSRAKWEAVQDLYSLCIRDFTVFYLPGLNPVDGACPVKCCQV